MHANDNRSDALPAHVNDSIALIAKELSPLPRPHQIQALVYLLDELRAKIRSLAETEEQRLQARFYERRLDQMVRQLQEQR